MITAQGAESGTQNLPAAHTPTDDKKKEVLKQYGLTCLSILTMHFWLGLLGFRYEGWKKYYFVDGQENKDTKQYWKNYIKTMLEESYAPFP